MAVNVMLKNNSGSEVTAELIDGYGGNFSATIDAGMSQNHSLMEGREIIVNGNTVYTVQTDDEGKEIVIAE